MTRSFELVPFGARAPEEAIACDGLVEGAALDLSHWSGNRTPPEWARDTSTESALAYAAADRDAPSCVVNNHFDTDGLCSVFALVAPEVAAAHAPLLVAAAEAGDFDEWPADERGLRLEAALSRLGAGAGSERAAYASGLAALPDLLARLDDHRVLWEPAWRALLDGLERARTGRVTCFAADRIAVFVHGEDEAELPGPVLHRLGDPAARRRLLAFARRGGLWDYRYERPRHAWADTVVRPRLPPPSRNAIARGLGDGWALKGELGMTGLLRTARPVALEPAEVARRLLAEDVGARA